MAAYRTGHWRGRHVSVQQYDEIGEAFEGFKSLPLMRYGEVPSFLGMVGDVSGRSVPTWRVAPASTAGS